MIGKHFRDERTYRATFIRKYFYFIGMLQQPPPFFNFLNNTVIEYTGVLYSLNAYVIVYE